MYKKIFHKTFLFTKKTPQKSALKQYIKNKTIPSPNQEQNKTTNLPLKQ